MLVDKSGVENVDKKVPLSNNEEEDHPPPYESQAQASSSQTQPSSLTGFKNAIYNPVGILRVNGYWLYARHESMTGTFIIDTNSPKSFLGDCHPKALMPYDERNKSFFKIEQTTPNASFHSQHGSIKASVSIEGDPSQRAFISARSQHGMVFLGMTSLVPGKHFLLEANTQHGQIVILLPPTFDGLVQIRKRHGSVTFLPEFAKFARLIQNSENESLFRFSRINAPVTETDILNEELDHCLVGSQHGSITLGISGTDHWEPMSWTGFWKKIKGSWS